MRLYCQVCDIIIDARGRHGHVRSNAHLAAGGGDVDSLVEFSADDSGEGLAAADQVLASQTQVARSVVEQVSGNTGDLGMDEVGVAELRRQIERLEAERDRAVSEAARFDPFVEVPNWATPEDVFNYFGEAQMLDIAELQLAEDNRKRIKEGRRPLYDTTTDEQYNRLLRERAEQLAVERIREKNVSVGAVRSRSIKMVAPNRNIDSGPVYPDPASYELRNGATIRQIPLEPQINNGKGNPAEPIQKMRVKGFKVISPLLCMLTNCHEVAKVANGKLSIGGYCSEAHRAEIEGNAQGQYQKVRDDFDSLAAMGMAGVPV